MPSCHRHFLPTLLLCLLAVQTLPATNAMSVEVAPEPHLETTGCLISDNPQPIPIQLEVADNPDSRALGLMHRDYLPVDAGMLFVFDGKRPGRAGFWMHNTLIPLDIAFLDRDGTIRRILTMQPCPHSHPMRCRNYRPGVDYHLALETNAGFFARHHLRVGDRLSLDPACAESTPASTNTRRQ